MCGRQGLGEPSASSPEVRAGEAKFGVEVDLLGVGEMGVEEVRGGGTKAPAAQGCVQMWMGGLRWQGSDEGTSGGGEPKPEVRAGGMEVLGMGWGHELGGTGWGEAKGWASQAPAA